MSMITLAAIAVETRPETRLGDSSFKTILLICCAGLAASFGLMAHGIDLGAGLMWDDNTGPDINGRLRGGHFVWPSISFEQR